MKAELVSEQLRRIARIEHPVEVESIPGDDTGLAWRTRIRLGVDDEGSLGFRRHRSHALERITSCPIAVPDIQRNFPLTSRWTGCTEVEVFALPGGPLLLDVEVPPGTDPALPDHEGGLVRNGCCITPPAALHTTVSGQPFRISAGVFWQAHHGAPTLLADIVRRALGALPGDHVVDLYAGAGLFSILLAQDVGDQGTVLAVERHRQACEDAAQNAKRLPQVSVRRASVTANLVARGIGHPDLLVLDPSREGAGPRVMQAIASLPHPLRRVAYVACDPASFSRDLRVLLDNGWTLPELRAFDIFPMTEHVELVATLEPPRDRSRSARTDVQRTAPVHSGLR
jgi:tRNA/tmRNA/rRNA uracil-C5-methylase (TrmA/RlmC/RlmD family)